jgi:hypothetical protein
MYKILSQESFWPALGIVILMGIFAVEAVTRLADRWQVSIGDALVIIFITAVIGGCWLAFMVYAVGSLFGPK